MLKVALNTIKPTNQTRVLLNNVQTIDVQFGFIMSLIISKTIIFLIFQFYILLDFRLTQKKRKEKNTVHGVRSVL